MREQWVYLSLEDVLWVHEQSIQDYGGAAGIRELGRLQSAVMQPQQEVFGRRLYDTAAKIAAAYCFFIRDNHAFVDGNKRTAFGAAVLFLEANGCLPADFDFTGLADHIEELAGHLKLVDFFQRQVVESWG